MENTMNKSNQGLLGDLQPNQNQPQGLLSIPASVKQDNRSKLSKEAFLFNELHKRNIGNKR